LRILEARARAPGPSFNSTAVATTWFHLRLSELPQEVMAVAWLDVRLQLIEFRELFRGTVRGTVVHVREAVRSALGCNAVHGIFAHNHPSGDATPSEADVATTRELCVALALVEVSVLDHIVVAPGAAPVSMARCGLLTDTAPQVLPRRRRGRRAAG
jgi:DNA repair protein RadC